MPDDRFIHPRLRMSVKVSALVDLEFRAWIDYMLVADNFGVLPYLAAMLRAGNSSLAARPDAEIQAALDHIVATGLLLPFSHQGQQYLCDPLWQDFQKVRYPRATYYPAPPEPVFSLLSDETRALFLRAHPSCLGSQKESELCNRLEAALRQMICEPITEISREYRLGDYRLDFLVETERRAIIIEAKQRAITAAAIDQANRYRDALSREGTVVMVVGTSLSPGIDQTTLREKNVVGVILRSNQMYIVVNPDTSLRLVAVNLPALGHILALDQPASGQSAADQRLTANGSTTEGGSGGKRAAADFDRFWAAYPRKVGKGKAFEAWCRLKPPLSEVLSAIEAQRKSRDWTKDAGQFIPHPTTWLNGKRWLDEPMVLSEAKRPHFGPSS